MKIDKRNPMHWIWLSTFAIQTLLGLLIRPFAKKTKTVLYGHKLNGNLLAIYQSRPDTTFLSMDRDYCKDLESQGVRSQWACSFGSALLLANAKAIISDHGLHSLEVSLPAYQRAGLKCFDVWHGIPFKGFDSDDFRLQHTYDEVWVASPLHKKLYVERYGFLPQKVVVTGYPRTDALVNPELSVKDLRNKLGLPSEGPIILFAPTWSQDAQGRSLYPFGNTEREFLAALSAFALEHAATVILRTHLNSNEMQSPRYQRIVHMPSSEWTNTEIILQVSNVLICDWSSIAFDYLLLDRPTLFLDVPAPFAKGFSLGPEYRFGAIISDLRSLLRHLKSAINEPEMYWSQYAEAHQKVRAQVYDQFADGQATKRCLTQLKK